MTAAPAGAAAVGAAAAARRNAAATFRGRRAAAAGSDSAAGAAAASCWEGGAAAANDSAAAAVASGGGRCAGANGCANARAVAAASGCATGAGGCPTNRSTTTSWRSWSWSWKMMESGAPWLQARAWLMSLVAHRVETMQNSSNFELCELTKRLKRFCAAAPGCLVSYMPLANAHNFAIAPSSDYKHQTSKSAPQLLRTLTSSPCIRSALKSWCKSYAHCTCFNTASCSVVSRAAAPADTPHGCLLTSNTTADASQPWRTAAGNRRVPDLRPCSRPQEGLHQGLRVELQSSRARQQGLLRGPM